MSKINKEKVAYVLIIAVMYFIIRNVVERSMDGAWLSSDKLLQTALEGLGIGIILMLFNAGKGKGKMPN